MYVHWCKREELPPHPQVGTQPKNGDLLSPIPNYCADAYPPEGEEGLTYN
jgi:hypothetical protein